MSLWPRWEPGGAAGGSPQHSPASPVACSWQVSSFSETRAQHIVQQKPEQYLRFNQHQLSRIYPSSYRVDSSNYNPQPFWNAGCHMGASSVRARGCSMAQLCKTQRLALTQASRRKGENVDVVG